MRSDATLAARLQATLLPEDERDETDAASPPSTPDRILDAAVRRFTEVGIDSTTMSSIAAEAGLSREWVYRHFANRDAIVAAAVQRELHRFIDGLAATVDWNGDVPATLTETFVYCVEFFRDHPVVDGVVDRGIDVGDGDLRARASTIVGLAVRTCAGYLVDPGGFDEVSATVIAETLTRLVGSTLIAPDAELDLHDPAVLRAYAERIVPAIVRSA